MAENEWITGRVTVRVQGVPLDLEMTVPAKPVKPHRMLPIFHQMANSFADIGIDAAGLEGRNVSCKAGCGSCCRQPVPVSEIEVYQIADLVESLPEPQRSSIKQRFDAAFEHFEKLGWFETFRREYQQKKTTQDEMTRAVNVVHKYFEEQIPCPFLENETCSIHAARPLACREYLVTSDPENCARLDGRGIEMVSLPIKPSRSVEMIARTMNGKHAGQLMLIQALRYVKQFPEHFDEKTGEAWMAEFFGGLAEKPADIPADKPPGPRRKKRHKTR